MKPITKAQRKAIARLYYRLEAPSMTYKQFRKTVLHGYDCLMVQWCNMWIGIEPDGYTHS